MGLPSWSSPVAPSGDDTVHVHFSFDRTGDNGLVVNYVMQEKKTGSGKT